MNAIYRRPVPRAVCRLLTLGLILSTPLFAHGFAHAQTTQALTVIVANFTDAKTKTTDSLLARTATDSVYNNLVTIGQGRFNPIDAKTVLAEAKTLNLNVPATGTPHFNDFDYTRLARGLNADAILHGTVNAANPKGGGPTSVLIDLTLYDAASGDAINGAQSLLTSKAAPGESLTGGEALDKTIDDAALKAVTQMTQRQLVAATVLNINQDTALLNKGTRDGLKAGDEVVIEHQNPDGSLTKVGQVRIARAYASDSEADIEANSSAVRPEDLGRVLYKPEFLYTAGNLGQVNQRSTRVNFSSIGKTLTALATGVIIAIAARGGQSSTTNVVGEASTNGTTPIVHVTWSNTPFGQAGVLEYHIYRLPDHPPGTPGYSQGLNGTGGASGGAGGTGGAGTGGTGTGLLTAGGAPIGVASDALSYYDDQPSPYDPYATTGAFIIASSNGGNNTGGNSGNNNNNGGGGNGTGGTGTGGTGTGGGGTGGNGTNGNGGCSTELLLNFDFGFTPGKTYQYAVTAIILRSSVTSNNGTGGVGGGTGGGGIGGGGTGGGGTGGGGIGGGGTGTGGNGGIGNNNTGFTCIETDPVFGGNATPVNPVVPVTPTANAVIDIRSFAPTFGSRAGADLFQIEVSTDRTFKTPSLIYYTDIFSTAPSSDGVTQNLSNPVNLDTQPALLANATFAAFVNETTGTTPATPQLYYRIGARHDEDQPGPVDWITGLPNAPSIASGRGTFRWVYSQIIPFQPAPQPPPPPGSGATTPPGTPKSVKVVAKLGKAASVIRSAGVGVMRVRTAGVLRMPAEETVLSVRRPRH